MLEHMPTAEYRVYASTMKVVSEERLLVIELCFMVKFC